MKRILVILFILLPLIIIAQVRVIEPPVDEKKEICYDSINNAPGLQVEGMVGQELFLAPIIEQFQEFGYTGLYCSSNKEPAPHDEVANHTFRVISVKEQEYPFSGYNMDLENIDTGIHYRYSYDPLFYPDSWPFITMGYKAKFEAMNKGKTFVSRGHVSKKDVNTGNNIEKEGGDLWIFQEIVAKSSVGTDALGYLFTNKENVTVVFYRNEMHNMFPKSIIDKYRKQYSKVMCDTALKGRIKIGMPKDLVVVAWGEPKDINISSYSEQWVYEESYVYFKNGKVIAWN